MRPYIVIKNTIASEGTVVFSFEYSEVLLSFFPPEKFTYLDEGRNTIKTAHEIIVMRKGRRVVTEKSDTTVKHKLIYAEEIE